MNKETKNKESILTSTKIKLHFVRDAKQQGINLTNEPFPFGPWILCFVQLNFIMEICKGLAFMFYEHYRERSYFLGDCRTLILAIGFFCSQCYGIILFYHRKKVYSLLNWCETISTEMEGDQQKYYKTIKNFQLIKIINVMFLMLCPIVTYIVTKERVLPVPFYVVEELSSGTRSFALLCVTEVIANFVFWQSNVFTLSFFYIMVQYVSNQYITLGQKIMKSCCLITVGENTNGKSMLDEIGAKHSELLAKLNEFSSIYNVILLFNEVLAVFAFVVSIVTFQYAINEAGFGLSALFVGSQCLIYPYLGQQIGSSAEYFARTVAYNEDWLNLSPTNRKKLALIMMVAQKPAGIKTGGFHFSDFLEIGQVLKLSYNVLIFINQVHKSINF